MRVSSTTSWVGKRYDFQLPAPTIDSVGGYSTTNLIVGYDGLRRISLYAESTIFSIADFMNIWGSLIPALLVELE